MTAFIISLIVFGFSLIMVIFIFSDINISSKNPVISTICIMCLLVSGVFGLGVIPITTPYKTTCEQIYGYNIIKSSDAIILDLTNSSIHKLYKTMPLIKYSSYSIVTSYSDSTRFYLKHEKSFYGVSLDKYIVWSNPPYSQYNNE